MKRQDFYYELPEELIAQDPLEDRSSSRLLVLDKESGAVSHHVFKDVIDYLNEGDCLVINDTKVLPARLIGAKVGTDAKIEVLLLKRKENNIWETLVKPAKRVKIGTVVTFGDGRLEAECTEILEQGGRVFKFRYEGIFYEILDSLGQMPLPPYITETLDDQTRYQTVFAKDVGLGTFRPVKVDEITDHHMHSEFFQIEEGAATKINRAKDTGKKVICVGTTSCRTVESAADETGHLKACSGWTEIFIYPGYQFKVLDTGKKVICVGTTSCRTVESAADETGHLKACSGWTEIFIYPGYQFKVLDSLITNFHLPESTLVMLVSALAGREHVLAAYEEAVKERYRFFSFGDAMLIQ